MNNSMVLKFDNCNVRFVGDKPVAKDVALALGYTNPYVAVSEKVDSEYKIKVPVSNSLSMEIDGNFIGIDEITVLEEPGIYQLIFSSYLPSAKQFKKWIFEEVLPQIRKTGNYIKTPKTYLEALEALVATEKEKQLLQSENKQLAEKIVEDAPKVEFADKVSVSDDCISIGDFAKVVKIPGLGRTRLFKKLRDLGILRVNNTPFQKFIERGYFEVTEYVTPIGIKLTTKITGRGQVWLTKKLIN